MEFAAKESGGRGCTAVVPVQHRRRPPGGYAGGCGLPQRGQGDGRLDGRVGVGCAAAAVDGRAPARANILIGPGGRGVLAGFDIVVNSGVRTTEQYLATTRHELAETGSTAATDVFALDRTVAALRDKCFAALRDECTEAERAASAASAAEVDAFVVALTARAGGAYVSALTA